MMSTAHSAITSSRRHNRRAQRKIKTAAKTMPDGMTVHRRPALLKELTTFACSRVRPKTLAIPAFDRLTRPTELQVKALKLLAVPL